jgi:hypothetical protein
MWNDVGGKINGICVDCRVTKAEGIEKKFALLQ